MKNKMISMLLVLGLIGSQALIVNAEELVVTQDTDLSVNPAVVTVTANVGSQYAVIIPKNMQLTMQEDGSYQCNYTIDVDGVISDNQYLSVVPQSEIVISTDGKDDVPLVVTQEVKNFRSSLYAGDLSSDSSTVKIDGTDTVDEASGNIRVKDGYTLTSGSWQGSLMFDISLNDDGASGTSLTDDDIPVNSTSGNDISNASVSDNAII